MSLLSATTLARLRAVYASALDDECIQLVYPVAGWTYASTKADYTTGSTLGCLFRPSSKGGVIGGFGSGSNELLGSSQVENSDAVIFISRSATVSALDRLRLTKLQGETLVTPITFEVVGGPVLDQVEHRITVRQVNDGSDS